MPRSIFTTATRIIWRDNCLAKQPRMRLRTWGKKLSAEYRMYRLWVREMCVYTYIYIWKRIGGIWGNINCTSSAEIQRWKMKLRENFFSNPSTFPWGKKSSCNTDRDYKRERSRDSLKHRQLAKLNSRDRNVDAPIDRLTWIWIRRWVCMQV